MDINITVNREAAMASIEEAWRSRAKAQGINTKTKAGRNEEISFFVGAMAALQAVAPNRKNPELLSELVTPKWSVNIMTGKPLDWLPPKV